MPSLVLEGHRLHYTTAGDPHAPPVLFVHGWMSHLELWDSTIAALKDQCFCVAVDLLGFAGSDKPDDADYSIPAQARRVLHLADALGWNQFSVVGHSMGGQIVLCLAAQLARARIHKVVDVDGVASGKVTPVIQNLTIPMVAAAVYWPQFAYAVPRFLCRFPAFGRAFFNMWFYDMKAVPYAQWAGAREAIFQAGHFRAAPKSAQQFTRFDLTPHLKHITAPTLVLFGKHDGVVPFSEGELVKHHVPQSQSVWFEQCGHFPMLEQPQAYLEALRKFLA